MWFDDAMVAWFLPHLFPVVLYIPGCDISSLPDAVDNQSLEMYGKSLGLGGLSLHRFEMQYVDLGYNTTAVCIPQVPEKSEQLKRGTVYVCRPLTKKHRVTPYLPYFVSGQWSPRRMYFIHCTTIYGE